ncbi:DUF1464 family protein [Geoglobus ahangari]|uniref:DUF1464 family protein n=1 Tax=Geoglobus ahangari TaxID=113653 RepID=UPI00064F8EAE|nr:DUF1464 family protein [Geoglobus ahangari]
MVSVGIDAGTKSYGVFVLEEGEHYEFSSSKVKESPEDFVEFLQSLDFDVAAGLSGYGLPVKRLYEISEKEFALMTLNFDREQSLGMRRVIELLREKRLNIHTIPAVIHLPTVPDCRKVNRIDMGTYDKVCSVAYVLHEFGVDETFILAELGYGFNAFIAVEEGRIVDGIGGTSGFPGYSSISAIDGELAYLMGRITKDVIFSGGLKSYFEARGKDFDADVFAEWVMKGIRALTAVVDAKKVYLSGRFAGAVAERVGEHFEVVDLSHAGGKVSAIGAAVIANGYAGKEGREVVERLELMRASGTVLDHLTPDVRKRIRFDHNF